MAKKDDILAQAMTLPAKQRAVLADELWFSLNKMTRDQIDRAWHKEVKSRWAAFEQGEIEALPLEDVMREARQRIRRRRQRRA